MEEKVEGKLAISIPHQDVLIFADIKNDIGYDILAQMTMSFLQMERFQLLPSLFIMKMGNLNRFLLWLKTGRLERSNRMNIFYNKEGVGDIFLISLQPVNQANFTYEKKDDVVKIVNSETGETAGFNLFNASNYVSFTVTKGLVDLTEELVAKLNEIINSHGFTDQLTADLSPKFVVGYVKEKEKHPQADKLSVCKVDVGTEILQIVCGAPNVDAGQKVVVAKIGAVMPSGLVIQPAELRGISSQGMICSARELALPNAPEKKGILVLEDTYTVGTEFKY